MTRPQVVIVGAGPAGLAAAVAAGSVGATVVLVDAGAQVGGQYWRQTAQPTRETSPDPEFAALTASFQALRASGTITYVAGKQVWLAQALDGGFTLQLNNSGTVDGPNSPRRITTERLVLCPGGYDRQLPIPGWDLPGVMTAGGLQALLKEHHVLAGKRVLLGGTGPFLLPVAVGLARAGATVVGICEANQPTGWLSGRRELWSARGVLGPKLVEAGRYAATLARMRIPYLTGSTITGIAGTNEVETAEITNRRTGRTRTVQVDTVGLGWGFTPSLELPLALGAQTATDRDGSVVVTVDDRQRSSVPGVWVAGEATGVGGAKKAVAEGSLAGLAVAADLGLKTDARLAVSHQRQVRSWRHFAAAMHTAHPVPADWAARLTPQTLVCRCEEVHLADIQDATQSLQADNPRLVKMLTRAGMGWCQGRVCGYAVGQLCEQENSAAQATVTGHRPLAFPVSLGDIATAE